EPPVGQHAACGLGLRLVAAHARDVHETPGVMVAGRLAELLGYDAHFTPSGRQRQPVQSCLFATAKLSPFGPMPAPSNCVQRSTNQSLRSVTLIAAPVAE